MGSRDNLLRNSSLHARPDSILLRRGSGKVTRSARVDEESCDGGVRVDSGRVSKSTPIDLCKVVGLAFSTLQRQVWDDIRYPLSELADLSE